jgi:signal transduction histidine kinase
VHDTGVGFHKTTQARLFKLFAQSDDGDTRRHGSAGVGLPFAARLVEAARQMCSPTPGWRPDALRSRAAQNRP